MNSKVLNFVNKLEGFKTAIKILHWDSDNMSQHELCDKIADSIAEFQDTVSEVEQSISGKLAKNKLKPTEYKVTSLKSFVNDVIDETNKFYKSLGEDEKYIGMRSDCESFLSDMQRDLYLVNFTLKENMKKRIAEAMYKNISNHDEVDKFLGRRPKTMKARINQIYKIVSKYGISSKVYHDDHWQAVDDYYKAISSLGCEVDIYPVNGGYTDYDKYDHMPRSKEYKVEISFDDGMNICGYTKMMACGSVEDPFSAYDTCIVLWPKTNKSLEENTDNKNMIKLTENQLKSMIKNSVNRILRESDDAPTRSEVEDKQDKIDRYNKRTKSITDDYESKNKSIRKKYPNKSKEWYDAHLDTESRIINGKLRVTESELRQIIKESTIGLLREWGFPEEMYDGDNGFDDSDPWEHEDNYDDPQGLEQEYNRGNRINKRIQTNNDWNDFDVKNASRFGDTEKNLELDDLKLRNRLHSKDKPSYRGRKAMDSLEFPKYADEDKYQLPL